jgi:thiol-disulfide isomerase/thioredoxin
MLCLSAAVHLAAQPYKIVVHVRAHDGTDLQASHASLMQYGVSGGIKYPASKTDDRYEFTVKKAGIYWIRVAGTHHRAFSGPILVKSDPLTEFEVRLGTLSKVMETPDSIFVNGSFNDYSLDNGLVKMTRQKNGVFTAVIETADDSVMYRPLLFVKGDAIPVDAPAESKYRYDSTRFTVWLGGNHYAVKHASKKKAKLTFRPKSLITPDLPVTVHFKKPATQAATLLTAHVNADFRNMKFRLASYNFLETQHLGNYEDFLKSYPTDKDISYLSTLADAPSDQLVRDVYNIASFHFSPRDSSRARTVLATLTPDADVWKLGYIATRHFLNVLPDRKEAASFAEKIAQHLDDVGSRAGYLEFALGIYHKADEKIFLRLYNFMTKEFTDYPKFLESLNRRFPVNKQIVVGKAMPDFEFFSMDDTTLVISTASLTGKTYLIDLWATWCMPCVAEMKELHRIYEKFREHDFTIVSFSFDKNPETVARFREKKWKMPWYNAFAGQTDEVWKKMGELFEVQALPRVILVDSKGVIVAVDEQATGGTLETLLVSLCGAE